MVLGSYCFGLCRFGFRGLCDDWGTNRVICGLNVFRILILLVFFVVCLYGGGWWLCWWFSVAVLAVLVVCGGCVGGLRWLGGVGCLTQCLWLVVLVHGGGEGRF